MVFWYPDVAVSLSTAEGYDRQKCATGGCDEPAGLLSPYCVGCRNEMAALSRESSLTLKQKLACMGAALVVGIIIVGLWNFAYYGSHPVTTTVAAR